MNGRYPFQLIICNDYADYLTKLDSVNQVTTFQFEHDWEGAYNHIEDPIFIVANKESVEIYSVDETWDLVCLETRIDTEWFA
ncbi:hypothetical protein [Marinilactibacillus kalidii]|uniref:hypothetical protein n=1 Tax=Marinilactibacillus kalidii TaxID=2820274 RepID=UPI001ABE588E|nr:hypothetical protein [Marinilactibacillus kalidii]